MANNTGNGGGVHYYNYYPVTNSITLMFNKWINCCALLGAALYLEGKAIFKLESNDFQGNIGTGVKGSTIDMRNLVSVRIVNSTFEENKGGLGAALACLFNQEIATQDVTILNITNSTLIGNTATQGGAIFSENCSLDIQSTHFHKNSAKDYGGAIISNMYRPSSTLKISSCHFLNNFCNSSDPLDKNSGGAISLRMFEPISQSVIENSNFSSNFANYGGSIAAEFFFNQTIQKKANFFVRNSTFSLDSVTANGGSVFFKVVMRDVWFGTDNFTLIEMENCTHSQSKANINGGAVEFFVPLWANQSTNTKLASLRNCSFQNCYSKLHGSAVFVSDNKMPPELPLYSLVEIRDNDFTDCSAGGGGTIYVSTEKANSISLTTMNNTNNFINCIALYGHGVATQISQIIRNYTNREIKYIFNSFPFDLKFMMKDWIGNVITASRYDDNIMRFTLYRIQNGENEIVNTLPLLTNKSNVVFEKLTVQGKIEKYNFQVKLEMTKPTPNSSNISTNVTVFMQGCPPGYAYSFVDGQYQCSFCGGNQYSFGGADCTNCPNFMPEDLVYDPCARTEKDKTTKKYKIIVANDYWLIRNSSTSELLLLACPGRKKSTGCSGFECEFECKDPNIQNCSFNCHANASTRYDSNGFGFCKEGYSGFLCASCYSGNGTAYYRSNPNKCRKCLPLSDPRIIFFTLFIPCMIVIQLFIAQYTPLALVLVLLTNVIYIFGYIDAPFYAQNLIIILNILFILGTCIDQKERISGTFKIMIFYLQISAFFPFNVGNNDYIERTYTRFQRVTSFKLQFQGIRCFLPINNEFDFIISTVLLPIIAGFLVVLLFMLQHIFSEWFASVCNRKKGSTVISDSQEESVSFIFDEDSQSEILVLPPTQGKLLYNTKRAIFFVLYLFYVQILSSMLSSLDCTSPPNTTSGHYKRFKYLYTYPWISCNSNLNNTYFVLAVVVTAAYVLLMLFGLLYQIRINRRKKQRMSMKQKEEKNTATPFSFFYDNYKSELYWFELIFFVEVTSIVFCINSLSFYYSIQKTISLSVVIFFLIIQLYVLPFARLKNNFFNLLATFVIFINMTSQRKQSEASSYVVNASEFLLTTTVLHFLLLFVFMLALASPSLRRFFKSKQYKTFSSKCYRYCKCFRCKPLDKLNFFDEDDSLSGKEESEKFEFDSLDIFHAKEDEILSRVVLKFSLEEDKNPEIVYLNKQNSELRRRLTSASLELEKYRQGKGKEERDEDH